MGPGPERRDLLKEAVKREEGREGALWLASFRDSVSNGPSKMSGKSRLERGFLTGQKKRATKMATKTIAEKQTPSKAGGMTCAFCKGTGKDPFGLLSPLSTCQVCSGTGKVKVDPPTAKCAFCNGTGVYLDKRLTCTACGGKGAVTVPKGAKTCSECNGSGQAPDGLPCLNCRGKGFA